MDDTGTNPADNGTNPSGGSDEPQKSALPARPWQAGEFDGTTLTIRESDVEKATVRYVHFTSSKGQRCESDFYTAGNLTEPWAIGWAIGMSPDRTYFSHPFVREGNVNAELAESDIPRVGGEFPGYVHGRSHSTIGGLDEGEEMTYYVAASYSSDPERPGGQMEFKVSCPDGMEALETGWSNLAYLLSDASMNGTSASVYAEVKDNRCVGAHNPKPNGQRVFPKGPRCSSPPNPWPGVPR